MRSIDRNPNADGASQAEPGSDGLLLERVRARDREAMAEIFDRYSGMVYSIALRVLADQGHAEDIMQDVFIKLWSEPDKFVEGRGSLCGWLAVMARHRAIDLLRRRKPTDDVETVVLPSMINVASIIERNTIMEKVRGVLKGLPQEQQMLVELAFFEGLSHTEIAAKTGDPLGTVKTRIRSILIHLRKAFQA
jgi:RNA polymerase sigma-70 factor (ECF subfamily)